jgi:5-oxopent-3-ene-1,2,5-tricarboxylate decarboxylase/2-hydroxyhepta-2,4-diene-1,7-dioate isomerase
VIPGTAYGVLLNDRVELQAMEARFTAKPYLAAPKAPIVYIKPRTCFTFGNGPVQIPHDIDKVVVSGTLAVLFRTDTDRGRDDSEKSIGGVCLAADLSEPESDYYRPAIRQRCRDGFLPLGRFTSFGASTGQSEVVTIIDGTVVHRWPMERLVRPIATLIGALSEFMTLRAGDLLLVGLPGDAPTARPGQTVEIRSSGLPSIATRLERESTA